MKKIIISGATSGIGRELAILYIESGYMVGVMGRRMEMLTSLQQLSPDRVFVKEVDINQSDAAEKFLALVAEMGGMDIYFHSSGIGCQNVMLDYKKELNTVETNCVGFTRMITVAFRYFLEQGNGHIGAISSIAGTRGLGAAPAYSASKRFQSHYLQCMAQLARIHRVKISITDIRPGFVKTDLLKDDKYPVLMESPMVAKKIFRAMCVRRRVKVIDWRYAVLVFLWRIYPRFLWERWRIKSK